MPDALPQNTKQWFAMVLTALVTLGGSYWAFRGQSADPEAKIRVEHMTKLFDENSKLREENDAKNETITTLQAQITSMQMQLRDLEEAVEKLESSNLYTDSGQILEEFVNHLPHPAWLHEVGENNWFLNRYYQQAFAVPRRSFWEPINVLARYPSDISAVYVSNDLAVVKAGVPMVFEEDVSDRVLFPPSPSNSTHEWEVLKIPLVCGGRNYVLGMCWRTGTATPLIDHFR